MVYRKPSNSHPPFRQPVGHLITQDVKFLEVNTSHHYTLTSQISCQKRKISFSTILKLIFNWKAKKFGGTMKNDLFSSPFLLLQNCLAQKFHQTLDDCVVNQKYSATGSLFRSSREYPEGVGRKSFLAGYAQRRILCLISHQWNTHLMFATLPEILEKHVPHQGGRRVRGGGGKFED